MKFLQNSDFHFNKVSLKMKNKEMNKETFVRFYREEISRAKLQEEIYSYKIWRKDIVVFVQQDF
jgi:hypothetical protein